MTQAILRGKISSSGINLTERLEDLLTSDVFGRLRYLKSNEALVPILNKIKNAGTGEYIDNIEVDPCYEAIYQFWPWINSVEPDLFIKVPLKTGKQLAILVECKHKSGKSDRDVKSEGEVDELDLAKRDQLVREYLIVEDLKKQYQQPILLYITGHSSIPDKELKESAAIVGGLTSRTKKMFYEVTYWMSWVDIWNTLRDIIHKHELDSPSRFIIEDIMDLLDYHGYRSFQQFPVPRSEIPALDQPVWYYKFNQI